MMALRPFEFFPIDEILGTPTALQEVVRSAHEGAADPLFDHPPYLPMCKLSPDYGPHWEDLLSLPPPLRVQPVAWGGRPHPSILQIFFLPLR